MLQIYIYIYICAQYHVITYHKHKGKKNYQQTSPTETKDCRSRKLKMCTRISCGSCAEPEIVGRKKKL
jgi:hypothetical protein